MKPFRDMEIRMYLAKQQDKMKKKIDSYTNDEIMANNLDLLADNLYEEFYIPPVVLYEEEVTRRSAEQAKRKRYADSFSQKIYGHQYIEVEGIEFTFYYPFEGNIELFRCQGSTFSLSGYPEINISGQYISMDYFRTYSEMEQLNAKDHLMRNVKSDYDSIVQGLGYVNSDVNSFNYSLRSVAIKLLQERHKKISSFMNIQTLFEIPVKKTEYSISHIPIKRNIRPIKHVYDRSPTYSISDGDYKDILDVIKHTASTYERTPSSYKSMQEEDLRNTLLASLNATFKGDAVGEAFRNKGKTDICIEKENRAAFVAECKIWNGPKEVTVALRQLDGYLTWRDCKTALIYFVRRKEFFKILDTAENALKTADFIRQCKAIEKNIFDCTMASESNPGQLVQVRVMLFNLYSE